MFLTLLLRPLTKTKKLKKRKCPFGNDNITKTYCLGYLQVGPSPQNEDLGVNLKNLNTSSIKFEPTRHKIEPMFNRSYLRIE